MTLTGLTPSEIIMAHLTVDEFRAFFKWYKGGPSDPQQDEAIEMLYRLMPVTLLEQDRERGWIHKYREAPPAPPKPDGPITPAFMHKYSGHPSSSFDQAFCDDFNDLLAKTGFGSDLTAFRMLIAQMAHESANWKYMKEIDSGHYLNGRADLGNTQPGDGPRFRGCGPIQTTGRTNHQRASDLIKSVYGIDDPKIMSVGTDYSADIYAFRMAHAWLVDNDYLNLCKGGDVYACTRRLNGGTNGLADRQHWYDVACRVIQQSDLA